MALTDGSTSCEIHVIQGGGNDALCCCSGWIPELRAFPLPVPLKNKLAELFWSFLVQFCGHFLVEFWDPAPFSLLEAVTSSGKQRCVREDPSHRHLAVLGGDPALSVCGCIHDKSFKNPGYWCLDSRANNPLEFFLYLCVIILCITGKTLGRLP